MRLGVLLLIAGIVCAQDLIIPGVGVGPVNKDSTEASLVADLGSDAVVADVDIGEGMFERGLVIYPNDPLRKLAVTWNRQGRPRSGHDFRLIRWGTDGGGFVTSFAGGKLADIKTKPGQLDISLSPPDGIRLTRAE